MTDNTTFTPSPAQADYFRWITEGSGSAILEAVAGAGKTTTIVRGLPLMAGGVCLVAYNSKIARELRDRVSGLSNVDAKTFHAAGYSALRRAFKGKGFTTRYPDDKKVLRIVERMVQEMQPQRSDLLGIEPAVAACVSMAKQRGIGALSPDTSVRAWEEMVEHFALDDALPEGAEEKVAAMIHLARKALRESSADLSVIDFDDMVYLALLHNVRFWQYDWLLIDEAQDLNPTRREMASRMLRRGGRLVAVGDPHQAIYGFTGTDNDSMEQIARQFGCRRLPLTVTYRCPKSVVDVARRYVSHIVAHETAPQGSVVTYPWAEVQDRVRVGDAVLCRYNKYLVSLCFRLIKAGVPAKIEGRSIGEGLARLAGRWKRVVTLTALEGRLEEYLEREVAKAIAKGSEAREQETRDRVETMGVLIGRARELGHTDVSQLQVMIREMFSDDVSAADIVALCSGHRSKGLEWDRVHVLGLDEHGDRSKWQWQSDQETNLKYVQVTRAKSELFLVTGLKDE